MRRVEDMASALAESYFRPRAQAVPEALVSAITAGVPDLMSDVASVLRVALEPNLGGGSRRFADDRNRPYPKTTDRPMEDLSPFTPEAVFTVVAYSKSMATAEKHARELAERLRPWRAVHSDYTVWSFCDRAPDVPYMCPSYDAARDSVSESLVAAGLDLSEVGMTVNRQPLPLLVRRCLIAFAGWELAVERDLFVGGPAWPFDELRPIKFCNMKNPFDALINVWQTGHLIFSRFTEADAAVRLYARRFGRDRWGMVTAP